MFRRSFVRASLSAAAAAGLVAGAFALSAPFESVASSSPTVTVNPSQPAGGYADQTNVTVSVGANTLFTPNHAINVLECADPGGTTAGLPIDDSTCDGTTIQPQTVAVAHDGSFTVTNYTLYELPNSILGEPSNAQPVCDLADPCVLYVGQDQNDFTQPKLFSAPFVIGAPTTTTVTSSGSPAAYGTAVTFTATVGGSDNGGTVTFSSGATTLCAAEALSGGQATCSTSSFGGGVHTVTATYSGDSRSLGSSGTTSQTVTGQPTATTLTSSKNPSSFGAPVTFTANVTPTDNGGSVTFTSGTTTLCSAVSLVAGSASCTTSSLPIGSDPVAAAYSGDTYFAGSSASLTQTVGKAPTSLSAAPAVLQVSPLGVNLFTLNAQLSANGKGLGGKTLVFSAGGTTVCTAVTSASGAASCNSLTNLSANVSILTGGGYTVTFAGDGNYLGNSAKGGLVG
jgi:hypothetical protein